MANSQPYIAFELRCQDISLDILPLCIVYGRLSSFHNRQQFFRPRDSLSGLLYHFRNHVFLMPSTSLGVFTFSQKLFERS